MHTLLGFRDPKSLGAHSGDRSICVFAYLIALLGGHFPILQYLIALLRSHFLYFGLGEPKVIWGGLGEPKSLGAHSECNVKKKMHTYCVFGTPNRWEPIVVAIDFRKVHTL